MADIFVSYTRADQDIVRRIVALLEAQGWSVWWDTRIFGGDRWDATIEREIKAARCVVVVWTPRSIDREWVLLEAHHGKERGILVPILIGVDKPPFAFSLIQGRDLTGWDGSKTTASDQLIADVRQTLGRALLQPASATGQDRALERTQAGQLDGRVKVDAKIVHGAPDGWFLPGAGKKEWFKDIDIGPEMVVVPAGSFTMGSDKYRTERPPHTVTIKAPFAVGRFAVTFAEWDASGLLRRPADFGWGRGRRPVLDVAWEDAKAYASWLAQKTGMPYRLPSEPEWEYCCRAGTTTKFAFGDEITQQQAEWGVNRPYPTTVEVGKFPSNAWGLCDMHGNVGEWCDDSWVSNYLGAPDDGSVRLEGGDTSRRVVRGGSHANQTASYVTSTARRKVRADRRSFDVGFRLARSI